MNINSKIECAIESRRPIREFSFIISPAPAVQQFVASLKKQVRLAIGHTYIDEFSKAHISIFKYKSNTENFLYRASVIAAQVKSFNIHVKDLTTFHHGSKRTIYLEIVNKHPIQELSKKLILKEVNPHITIARNLSYSDFLKAVEVIGQIKYSHFFSCESITVLTREQRGWKPYLNLPLATHVVHPHPLGCVPTD